MTPEGKVKAKVKRILAKHGLYSHWPVPCGYGDSTLDCIVCVNGTFLGIETKAPGGKPTARQEQVIKKIRDAGGTAFVIDGTDKTTTYEELEAFLEKATHAPSPRFNQTQDRRGAGQAGREEPLPAGNDNHHQRSRPAGGAASSD